MTSHKLRDVSDYRRFHCAFNSLLGLTTTKILKFHFTSPLWEESTDDRWIQKAFQCQDVMTSWCTQKAQSFWAGHRSMVSPSVYLLYDARLCNLGTRWTRTIGSSKGLALAITWRNDDQGCWCMCASSGDIFCKHWLSWIPAWFGD